MINRLTTSKPDYCTFYRPGGINSVYPIIGGFSPCLAQMRLHVIHSPRSSVLHAWPQTAYTKLILYICVIAFYAFPIKIFHIGLCPCANFVDGFICPLQSSGCGGFTFPHSGGVGRWMQTTHSSSLASYVSNCFFFLGRKAKITLAEYFLSPLSRW